MVSEHLKGINHNISHRTSKKTSAALNTIIIHLRPVVAWLDYLLVSATHVECQCLDLACRSTGRLGGYGEIIDNLKDSDGGGTNSETLYYATPILLQYYFGKI